MLTNSYTHHIQAHHENTYQHICTMHINLGMYVSIYLRMHTHECQSTLQLSLPYVLLRVYSYARDVVYGVASAAVNI